MKQTRQIWWIVTLGIMGLTIGYSAGLFERGTVLASPVQCPASHNNAKACTSGECSKECPGNCLMHKNV
jgi:hypothetical protein